MNNRDKTVLVRQSDIPTSSRLVKWLGRVGRFLLRHAKNIWHGGPRALLGTFCFLLAAVPGVLILVVVRLLRPIVVIRFGELFSESLGHYALNTELFLCERGAGMHSQRTFDFFYNNSLRVCNVQLQKMWNRILPTFRFTRVVGILNRYVPGGSHHVIPSSDRDVHGLLDQTKAHLSLTDDEERLGRAGLRGLGIPEGAPFICFYARDSVYMDKWLPGLNWRYHDYRNCSIHNYVPAAEELTCRGLFAIRMGAVVKEALTTKNAMIIDYATKGRTDFLDIFLMSKSRFFLCSSGGLTGVSMIFRRPVACANVTPLEYTFTSNASGLFIPKKLWLRKEHRFLTFREIISSGAGRFLRSEQYERLELEVIENTPEEITSLAVEMHERLDGRCQGTEEDDELQREFWAIFNRSGRSGTFDAELFINQAPGSWLVPLHGEIRSRIGTEFLRQNKALLE